MKNNEFEPNVRKVNTRHPQKTPLKFTIDEIYSHFADDISSIKAIDSLLKERVLTDTNYQMLLSSQLVFLESSFDFFIHEISKYGFLKIYNSEWTSTEKTINLKININELIKCIDKEELNDIIYELLNSAWSTEVFISYDNFKDQLNLIGLKIEDVMKAAFPPNVKMKDPINHGKTILTELYRNRNVIAHQMSRSHSDASKSFLNAQYINDSINNICSIAKAIYNIIKNK